MPLLPRRPSALARHCCATDQRDARHDSCRLYATCMWPFWQRFMLWSNASNGCAATVTVLEVEVCVSSRCSSVVHACQKWVLSDARCTPQPTSCEHFVPKAKSCSAWGRCCEEWLFCLSVCSVSCPWMKLCDSRPQHIAIGLAILDHHNPCTTYLPAPYYLGGYRSAGKQDSYSCDTASLTLHAVNSVCLSHHESRTSCCRSTFSSSSISSKKMKLQNHIKPPYLEIRVSPWMPA
jgi:hypothetical protein